jgi:restriction endonuclease S subunit
LTRPFDEAKYNALLNGLEISEIKFSELISGNRLDAEVYERQYISIERRLAKHPTVLLGDIALTLRKGIFDINASVYSDSGVPFVRISNLRSMQIQGDFVCIPESVDRENHKTHLSKGDIVLSKTACAAVSLVTVDECNVSQDTVALKLKPKCGIRSDFLVTYFNTRDGLLLLRRWFTGNIQMHLNLEDCSNIAVPVFSDDLQIKIGKLLQAGIAQRELSEFEFEAAQMALLQEIDYIDTETRQSASVKSFSESYALNGRLDAEFYQPKYDELERHIRDHGNCIRLSEAACFIQRGRQPSYADDGLTVINSRHVQSGFIDLAGARFALEPDSNELVVKKGDLLLNGTGRGTIGRCAAYLADEQALPDNHVTIIRCPKMDPVYLSVYLNSVAGQMQVDRFYKGSSGQIELYPEDIGNFLIWDAPAAVQKSIRESVETGLQKKAESHRLLEKAKQAVEIAIEKGEEAAMAYLEGRSFVAQTITQDLAQKAPYFSIDAVRNWLAEQKMIYKPDTVKTYLSRQKKEGKIFDAGRGWYSSIATPYQLDSAPVEKIVGKLKAAFPLLDFACWSTAQLNEMLRHQLAKHVQFVYVERDAINSVADWLKDRGYHTCVTPGKKERESFSIEEKTAIVLPLTTKAPRQNGFATIEKIVVDVLADVSCFSIINIPEFIDGSSGVMKSQRVDMADLMKYSTRRKTDISSLIKGLKIH